MLLKFESLWRFRLIAHGDPLVKSPHIDRPALPYRAEEEKMIDDQRRLAIQAYHPSTSLWMRKWAVYSMRWTALPHHR